MSFTESLIMVPRRIKRVLVEEGAQDYEMTRRGLAWLKGVSVTIISDRAALKAPEPKPGCLAL